MSIRKNFLYSSILTTASYLFPLITFPYVSRVLGVTNIGICNFVDGIIGYFILFSMLGIQTLGIREIARNRENKGELSKTFFSIIALNLMFVSIVCLALVISTLVVPQFAEYKTLMYIGLTKLLFTFSMIEWFYRGLEDFRFITIRSLIIRCIYVVCVFLLVRSENDYPIYFALSAATEGLNALVNCIHARKYLTLVWTEIHPLRYLKSSLTLGCYSLLTSMYTSFNVVYLGLVTNATEVGYYTTATKLHKIIIGFLVAFTGVMLPRMSNLLAEGKHDEFNEKIRKSFSVLILFSFPIIVFCSIFTSEIISIISGSGYEKAAIPLSIVMPLVFIIGFEQILVVQILTALKKDSAILANSIIGAVVGVTANILLVKNWGCIGSSWVWVISEVCVMASAIVFSRRYFSLKSSLLQIIHHIIYAIPAVFGCVLIKLLDIPSFWTLSIAAVFIATYYGFLYLCVLKDKDVVSLLPKRIQLPHSKSSY